MISNIPGDTQEYPKYLRAKRSLKIPDRIFQHSYPTRIRIGIGIFSNTQPNPILKNPTSWALPSWKCNNTLPRGGVYWKIRPLRQSRGPRGANCRGGRIFQFIPTRGSVLPFYFPEQECIRNYSSNSRGVWTKYKFSTLSLYKR